jgi:hypothetical protein
MKIHTAFATIAYARPMRHAARSIARRAIALERSVDCPFSLALDEAEEIVALLERPLPGSLGRVVTVRAERRTDLTEPGRRHDELAFECKTRSTWIPDFRGVLRFRFECPRTRILLTGSCRPPAGRIGAAFNRILGERLTISMLNGVLRRFGRTLEAHWTRERAR